MSHNVQKYDRQVYLRVSEAQRCRVHSTLVMPVFDVSRGDGSGTIDLATAEAAAAGAQGLRPVAVFELVQADRDVAFPEVIAQLRKCLLVGFTCGVVEGIMRGWAEEVGERGAREGRSYQGAALLQDCFASCRVEEGGRDMARCV